MSATESAEIVVFSVLNPSVCTECAAPIAKGEFLRMEEGKPLCLECADLDHLDYLPSGDATLTRRSKKGSGLWATVLRFSRSRGRYERQGLLVERAALEAAEAACEGDADRRAVNRERDAVRREVVDEAYQESFAREIARHYPGCNAAPAIAAHACEKYSGRVGRSAGAKSLDTKAIELAVRAHVRHVHTPYDSLLLKGVDRHEARRQVGTKIDEVLETWRSGSRLRK